MPSPIPAAAVNTRRQPFPVPVGLFVALGLYAIVVVVYIWATYWRSDHYQAAQHYDAALEYLGVDECKSCSKEDLESAFKEMCEAARLIPTETELHRKIERLRGRFVEKGYTLPRELQMRAESVSLMHERARQQNEAVMVVGLRDRGWHPEQLSVGPQRAALWAIPGGLVIVVIWAALRFSARNVRAKDHEAEVKALEKEVKELAGFRPERTESRFEKMAREAEVADPTPPDPPPKPKVKTTGARPAVKRKPPA